MRHAHAGSGWGSKFLARVIDIILRVPELEMTHFCGAMGVALVTEQFSVKHPYTGHYQAINSYTTMADKEMTLCTIFVNGYLRNAKA